MCVRTVIEEPEGLEAVLGVVLEVVEVVKAACKEALVGVQGLLLPQPDLDDVDDEQHYSARGAITITNNNHQQTAAVDIRAARSIMGTSKAKHHPGAQWGSSATCTAILCLSSRSVPLRSARSSSMLVA